jgi:hypothetical protein
MAIMVVLWGFAGVYNQKNWDALDSIVDMASKSGVRLIMPFADKCVLPT